MSHGRWFLTLLILGIAGCIEIAVTDSASLTVFNNSVADRLPVALTPIDALSGGDSARLDGGETATLWVGAGLYALELIDTAGDGCVIREFALLDGDAEQAEVTDFDLVDCTTLVPPTDFPGWD